MAFVVSAGVQGCGGGSTAVHVATAAAAPPEQPGGGDPASQADGGPASADPSKASDAGEIATAIDASGATEVQKAADPGDAGDDDTPRLTPAQLAAKFSWCAARDTEPKKAAHVGYFFPAALAPVDTYSIAAVVPTTGRIVQLSGQLPIDDQYALQGTTLVEQLYAALKNLCISLEEVGATTADVYRIGVMYVHKDAADPFVLAEEIRDFFGREQPPVATMMAVPIIVTPQMRVQVEASALLPAGSRGRKMPR
jgi:enamine deaminase RidA (YjgF/YER057c/UK114 family)